MEYECCSGKYKNVLIRHVPSTAIQVVWDIYPNDDRSMFACKCNYAVSGENVGVVMVPAADVGWLTVTGLLVKLCCTMAKLGHYSRLQKWKNSYGYKGHQLVRFP